MCRVSPSTIAPQDARLGELLRGYPEGLFTERFYAACELVDRYVLARATGLTRALGVEAALRQPTSAAAVAAACGFQKGFLPALRWLLERLVVSEDLAVADGEDDRLYRLRAPLPERDPAPIAAALLANDPQHAPTLRLLDLAAETYPAVARGARGADALFGLGQVALWCDYFHNGNPVYAVNNRVAAVAAARRLQGRRGVRILEVGAGAGSATAALLAELGAAGTELAGYRVTEPSQFFRRRAERALRAAFPQAPLAFGTLDIDRSWAEQGAEPGGFDLVFGVNVLHVARNLQYALREAHATLAPDGGIVLGEAQRLFAGQPIWAEFVFQLLDGFTAVETDEALRPTHGFLQPETWIAALRHAGFADVVIEPDVIAIRDFYPRFHTGAVCGRHAVPVR